MKKLCLISAWYTTTGVPLAQFRLAHALARRGFQVDLIYGFFDPNLPPPVSDRVNIINLDVRNVRGMFMPIARYLATSRPEVVFSAEDHLNGCVLLAAIACRSSAKISCSSRVSPFDSYSNAPFTRGWLRKLLMKCVMWRADALTCVSQDMVAQYKTIFPNSPHVCVHNVIVDERSRARMTEEVDHPWFTERSVPIIIGAGTITTRKNFEALVEAFNIAVKRGRRLRLVILGEGDRRPFVEELVRKYELEDIVWLPGNVLNTLKYFHRSDVFVLTSLAEGLPNVLVEAMLCGCTPVATDCPTGPREVLVPNKVGHLVPMHDDVSLADAIERAVEEPASRQQLDAAIRAFDENAVIDRHFEVLGLQTGARQR